jgi:hypothetical protein
LLLLLMMMLWEKGREACKCEWSLSYREYWHGWWVENLRAGRVAFGLDWVIYKDNNNTPLLKFQFGDFFFFFLWSSASIEYSRCRISAHKYFFLFSLSYDQIYL